MFLFRRLFTGFFGYFFGVVVYHTLRALASTAVGRVILVLIAGVFLLQFMGLVSLGEAIFQR